MTLKFGLLVVALLALASVLAENSVPKREFDLIIEVAEKILETVSKDVNLAIREVVYGLRVTRRDLDKVAKDSIKLSEEAIQKEVQVLHEWLEQLTEAVNLDEVVFQCIEDNEQQIAQTENEAIETSTNCINEAFQKCFNDTLNEINDIENLNNELLNEEQKLEDCKGAEAPLECVRDVINKLVQLALTLSVKIQQDANLAQADFDKFYITNKECGDEMLNIVKEEFAGIYNNITDCIKFNGNFE